MHENRSLAVAAQYQASPYHKNARRLSSLLIALLWAVCLYKAATVAISADEAYTYNRSVSVPIPRLWDNFDANDHVLHTLLCKLTVGIFGICEVSLRMPALGAGLLLLWMLRRLSFWWFGEGWFGFAVFGAIAVNPFLLDYASMARGYGMALAFWLVAWDQLQRHHEKPHTRRRLWVAGLSLALSVAANLTFALPGIALLAAYLVLHVGVPLWRRETSRARARFDWMADHVIVPGFVTAVTILLIPLLPMKRSDFYVGSTSLRESAINLLYAQLWRPKNLFEGSRWHFQVEAAVVQMALPLLLSVLGAGIVVCLWRAEERRRWLGVTSVLIALLLAIFSYGFGMPFPYRRTGLYLVPVLTWLGAAVLTRFPRPAAPALGSVWVLWLLGNWNLRYYDEWLMDAGNKEVMRYIRTLAPGGGNHLAVGATFPLGHSLRFYRNVWHLDWLEIPEGNKTADGVFDIYVIGEEEAGVIAKRSLITRYHHPLANVSVAVPIEGGASPPPNSNPAVTSPGK